MGRMTGCNRTDILIIYPNDSAVRNIKQNDLLQIYVHSIGSLLIVLFGGSRIYNSIISTENGSEIVSFALYLGRPTYTEKSQNHR